MGAFAFSGLTSVDFQASITTVTDYAFAGCKLTSITILKLLNDWNRAFCQCSN